MINIEVMKTMPFPGQHQEEWFYFLTFLQNYFESIDIMPLVVEIGSKKKRQKDFYERFVFGSDYIGIDRDTRGAVPEILGLSQDQSTLDALKELMEKRGHDYIDLLFIDGDHRYANVKKDYEMYSPLVEHIVAFHDLGIEGGPGRLFNEIQQKEFRAKTFMTFRNYTGTKRLPDVEPIPMGIGLVIYNQIFQEGEIK